MANTSVFQIANTCLVMMGLIPIASPAIYNNGIPNAQGYNGDGLDKYQAQLIMWFDILHRQLAITMTKRFMWRRFQFVTANNAANATKIQDYVINDVIVEGFRANSFWNVTYGSGPGNSITVIPYENFMRMYARPDIIPYGAPQWLAPLPDDGSGICTVRLNPIPDQIYTIEGQARLLVPPIKNGTDLIAFPPHYEHALILKTIEALEYQMNEGRAGAMTMMADAFLQEVFRDAGGADEETDQWNPGFCLWNRWRSESARDYNPATDTAPPYP